MTRRLRSIALSVLLPISLGAVLYAYNMELCDPRRGTPPVFGMYTIYCLWDGGVKGIEIYQLQTTADPRLDPLSRYLCVRLARNAVREALGPAGATRTFAEIDVMTYGKLFPC